MKISEVLTLLVSFGSFLVALMTLMLAIAIAVK